MRLSSAWLHAFAFGVISTSQPGHSFQLSLAEATDLVASEIISLLKRDFYGIKPPQIMFGVKNSRIYGGCVDRQGHNHFSGTSFCGPTNTIYLERDQLERLRSKHGDGAIAYAIAHETGH